MQTLTAIRHTIEKIRSESPLAAHSSILLGASKGQNVETIERFITAGLADFGENRVQEAAEKWPSLKKRYPHVRLHLIGPLQSNKVKEALALFDVIQTLDRPKLADAIAIQQKSANTPPRSFYVQVNTGEEPQKSGVIPRETSEFIRYCRALHLNIVGLMCIPPADAMPAPHFALLRQLATENDLHALSMGMSSDFETALRMGSNCIRIGTALFGERSD